LRQRQRERPSVASVATDHLRRLQRITDAALAHLQLDELLAALLMRTRDELGVDTAAILLLDEDANELVAHAAVGLEEEVEQGVRIPVGRGFAGRIAANVEPLLLADVDHADVLNPILREKGIKTLLGVPLVVEGRPIGVLHVGSLTPRTFEIVDVELLQLVGDRASLAIDHARLYEAERNARRRLEHVQAVTDVALAELDLEELMRELLKRIKTILAVDTAAILLLDEEHQELVARAALGIEEEVEQGVRIPLGRGFAGRVAATRRPVILPDLDVADIFNPILRQKKIKSMLGVPLLVHNLVIGVLHVGSLTPRDFTKSDTELLQLVGERVAVAIERASVYEKVVELDRLRMNFVAVASHELRTPAASLYGILATLDARGDGLTAEIRKELIRTGREQGERMRRLLEQLLDLSRLDAQAIRIAPEPLVLRTVLADIADIVTAGNGTSTVDLRVPADLAVVADKLVIERVVTNLLVNAHRYGEPPVVVSAQQSDNHLRIAVEDSGAGVPEDLRPRLFARFERGGQDHGAGLGLAIARAYANAHGGDLMYEPLGRGSRFELLLPRSSGA
jgi:signal transduction histidine kinase